MQPKLLRFLEDGVVQPVGDMREFRVDVRIIAATNAPISEMALRGTFRKDLLARLEAASILVLPLRERRDDVLPMLRHFASAEGCKSVVLHPDAAEALLIFGWPRNARGLRNLVAQLVRTHSCKRGSVCVDFCLELGDLPEELSLPIVHRETAPVPPLLSVHERPSEYELRGVLDRNGWNIHAVAAFYKKDRKQVYRWMEHYGIDTGE